MPERLWKKEVNANGNITIDLKNQVIVPARTWIEVLFQIEVIFCVVNYFEKPRFKY